MNIIIAGRTEREAPWIVTRILNPEEHNVIAVGVSATGHLCYRKKWHLFPTKKIQYVRILKSSLHKDFPVPCMVEVVLEITTQDYETVVCATRDRKLIKCALNYLKHH